MKVEHTITKGFFWKSTERCIQYLGTFIATVILARLLVPEHFGLITTAGIIITLFSLVRSFGLKEAMIQCKDVDEEHLSTAFFTSIFLGVSLCILTLVIAPFCAEYFDNVFLTDILRLLSLTLFIDSIGTIPHMIIIKRLDFKRSAIPPVAGIIVYAGVGISLALMGAGAFSLAWALVIKSAVTAFLNTVLSNWRPKMRFRREKINSVYRFGLNVTKARLLDYCAEGAIYIIVAKFLGQKALGLFFLAYNISKFFYTNISPIVLEVLFPTFSKIRDSGTIKEFYLKSIVYLGLVSTPLYICISVMSRQFVQLIYGEQWLVSAQPLQILCVMGMLRSLRRGSAGAVLYANGRSDIDFKLSVLSVALTAIAAVIGVTYGITGIAIALTVKEILVFFIIIHIVISLVQIKWKEYFKNIFPVAMAAGVMSLFLIALNAIYLRETIMDTLIKLIISIGLFYGSLRIWGIDVLRKIKRVYGILTLSA